MEKILMLYSLLLVVLPTLFFLLGFRKGYRWGKTPEKETQTFTEKCEQKKTVKAYNEKNAKEIEAINAELEAINSYGVVNGYMG